MVKSKISLIILSVLIVSFSLFATSCSKDAADASTSSGSAESSSSFESAEKEEDFQASEKSTEAVDDKSETTSTDTSATSVQDDDTENKTSENVTQENLSTPKQIVDYFNECANKVKTDASKVVKNYEKRKVGKLKVPDSLQSTAEKILASAMKDDTEPQEYTTKDEIQENFIVPNQNYVSKVTVSDLENVTCKDNGKTYEIYLKLKNEKNPVSGKGVGSVCDVIESREVSEKAPSFLKEFSTYYSDCEVRATIDKETGRMIHAVYTTPVRMDVVVDLFGTHNATVNFTFIKDYTITY